MSDRRLAISTTKRLNARSDAPYARRQSLLTQHSSLSTPHLLLLLVAFFLTPPDLSSGASNAARRQVREGIRRHTAGEYEAAAEAFAKAAVELPEDPRVAFDQACSLAAQGKRAEATDLFQRAATSRDESVVASSHYNLGCLAADEAKELLGADPAEATPEVREQVIRIIGQAVVHYRDCLRGDPEHKRARRNLEVLRLWMKHMQDVWARRDREKRREEMDLLQFLEWMASEQRALEATAKTLDQLDSSPRQRQAIRQAGEAQRMLAEEVDFLERKLEAAVADAAGETLDEATKQASEGLAQLTRQSRTSMFKAADELAARSMSSAMDSQSEAIRSLNEIFRAVAPFESVLQKATATQEQLLDVSKAMHDADDSEFDIELLSRDQEFVAGWAEALPEKARLAMTQVPQVPAENEEQAQQVQEQQAATKEAYNKAMELAPQVVDLARDAAEHITGREWEEARPKQEEALRLLKEMTPPPQDNQQQQQDQQQDQNEEQDETNQQKNQQQDKQSDDEQDQKKSQDKEQQEKKQQQDDQQRKKQNQERTLSRQQAEALLRKVRQREREHRDREKKLRALLQGSIPVDRDW